MLLREIKILKENVQLPDEVVAYIHEYCQPYLNAVGGDLTRFMWRGVSDRFFQRTSTIPELPNCSVIPGHYNDRISMDTHPDAHNLLNQLFVQYHGEPFRNGIFTCGAREAASYYGNPVIVFPIGEFKFCWSFKVQDMVQYVPNYDDDKEEYDKLTSQFDKLVRLKYKTTDLISAIHSSNEIMIYCNNCLVYNPEV